MAITLIVSLSFILLGLVQLYSYRHITTLRRAAIAWPRTSAIVVESHITKARPKQDEHDSLRFIYRFEIDGILYSSYRVFPEGEMHNFNQAEMQTFVDQHPKGSAIEISYNPLDVRQSGLYPPPHQHRSSSMYLGITLLLLGLIAACVVCSVN